MTSQKSHRNCPSSTRKLVKREMRYELKTNSALISRFFQCTNKSGKYFRINTFRCRLTMLSFSQSRSVKNSLLKHGDDAHRQVVGEHETLVVVVEHFS